MPGHIQAIGASSNTIGSSPVYWGSSTANQGVTITHSEGVSFNSTTGYFTVQAGYAGDWAFEWGASLVGQNGDTVSMQVIADPAGAATVVATAQRKLGTGADIGNMSVRGAAAVTNAQIAGGTAVFGLRITGDITTQFTHANLIAWVIDCPGNN